MTQAENNEEEKIEVLPEDIYQKLLNDLAVHETATEAFIANFSFYGRTLKEHSEALWIEIPEKPNPEEYRNIFVKLSRNIQIVTHYLSVSTAISNAIIGGTGSQKSELIKTISDSYLNRKLRRPLDRDWETLK